MRFYFVRHGYTPWTVKKKVQGRKNILLNQTGREQAKRTAQMLLDRQIKIEAIVTSSLDRTKEAAKIIHETINEAVNKKKENVKKKTKKKAVRFEDKQLELFPERRLIDRDYGSLEGRPKAEVKKILSSGKLPEGVEERNLVGRRSMKAAKIYYERGYEHVVFVSHGGNYKSYLEAFFDMSEEEISGQHLAYIGYMIFEITGDVVRLMDKNERVLREGVLKW